jgi:uncharacterized repeat protein (TIGR01451 family)
MDIISTSKFSFSRSLFFDLSAGRFSLTNTPALPKLAITKTVTLQDNPPSPGQTITYTIVVANNGNGDAKSVTIQDILPSLINGADLNQVVTLTAHSSVTFTISASIATNAGYGVTVLNTASFSHTSGSGSDTAGFTTQTGTSIYLPLVRK